MSKAEDQAGAMLGTFVVVVVATTTNVDGDEDDDDDGNARRIDLFLKRSEQNFCT